MSPSKRKDLFSLDRERSHSLMSLTEVEREAAERAAVRREHIGQDARRVEDTDLPFAMSLDFSAQDSEAMRCVVCGDRATGYHFEAITCESCKAFFRRNAFREKDLKCTFNSQKCDITSQSRRSCAACRLKKCYSVGMKRENILTEEEKALRRAVSLEKIRRRGRNSSGGSGEEASPFSIASPPPPASLSPLGREFVAGTHQKLPSPNISSHSPVPTFSKISFGSSPLPTTSSMPYHSSHSAQGVEQLSGHHVQPGGSTQGPNLYKDFDINMSSNRYPNSLGASLLERFSDPQNSHMNGLALMRGLHEHFLREFNTISESAAYMPTSRSAMASHGRPIRTSNDFQGTVHKPTKPISSLSLSQSMPYHRPPAQEFAKMAGGSRMKFHALPHSAAQGGANYPESENAGQLLKPKQEVEISSDSEMVCSPQPIPHSTYFRSSSATAYLSDSSNSSLHDDSKFSSCEKICIEKHIHRNVDDDKNPPKSHIHLTPDEEQLLIQMHEAHKLVEPLEPLALDPQKYQSASSFVDALNMVDYVVRGIIKMAKNLHPFTSLSQEDQISLLKGGCMEIILLRSVMTLDLETGEWEPTEELKQASMQALGRRIRYPLKLDFLKRINLGIYESHRNFVISFPEEWRRDLTIMILLKVIVLFSPDRPNVRDQAAIEERKQMYINHLIRYLETLACCGYLVTADEPAESAKEASGSDPYKLARHVWNSLEQRIKRLRTLQDEHVTIMVSADESELGPLLAEMYQRGYDPM